MPQIPVDNETWTLIEHTREVARLYNAYIRAQAKYTASRDSLQAKVGGDALSALHNAHQDIGEMLTRPDLST